MGLDWPTVGLQTRGILHLSFWSSKRFSKAKHSHSLTSHQHAANESPHSTLQSIYHWKTVNKSCLSSSREGLHLLLLSLHHLFHVQVAAGCLGHRHPMVCAGIRLEAGGWRLDFGNSWNAPGLPHSVACTGAPTARRGRGRPLKSYSTAWRLKI